MFSATDTSELSEEDTLTCQTLKLLLKVFVVLAIKYLY